MMLNEKLEATFWENGQQIAVSSNLLEASSSSSESVLFSSLGSLLPATLKRSSSLTVYGKFSEIQILILTQIVSQ